LIFQTPEDVVEFIDQQMGENVILITETINMSKLVQTKDRRKTLNKENGYRQALLFSGE